MTELPVTRWRIVAIPGSAGINVLLIVDTIEPRVVEWIERGARETGVELIRLGDEE